jgi:hypothetical protein
MMRRGPEVWEMADCWAGVRVEDMKTAFIFFDDI